MKKINLKSSYLFLFLFLIPVLNSCGGGSQPSSNPSLADGVYAPDITGEPTAFRGAGKVGDPKYLIGGPLAQGRVGDILIQNDKIRIIIQKPRRNSGVALYGGNIIDADILRPAGEPGRDNFGITFPLINVSWTPFYKRLEVVNADFSKGPVIVRATGVLDVYDYIQTSIIVPFAKIAAGGIKLFFPQQFNDATDPFSTLPRLKVISTTVVTEYILKTPTQPYLIVQTYLQNSGKDPVSMPIGDWINSSGTLENFIPGTGFTGQGLYSSRNVPAVLNTGMETDTQVSYGFFYDVDTFKNSDGTYRDTQLLTVSGVSILAPGEQVIPGLIPTSNPQDPSTPLKISFSLPPGQTTYTRYFAVGNGDSSALLSGGLQALGIPTAHVAGTVTDISNAPIPSARVYVIDTEITPLRKPVAVFYTDANGKFSGDISTGVDSKAKLFGSGKYNFEVYKEGYVSQDKWSNADSPHASLTGKGKAGSTCNTADLNNIQCQLGNSALVTVTSNGPARIAIVGFDPSPFHAVPPRDTESVIADIEFQGQQYGYIDALFLDKSGQQLMNTGNPRYVGGSTFRLEPGTYMIFVTRGPEYSMHYETITLNPGDNHPPINAVLNKVVDTTGYISGDFHIHGINSPDSPYGFKARVSFALAEGLDIMVSADHDVITDYGPTIQAMGVQDFVTSIPGDEITPMAFGHFIAFPLQFKPDDPTGGAFDYTNKEGAAPGPSHHQMLSPGETLTKIDELNSGEQVLQVNHIMDPLLGNFALSGLITSTHFPDAPPLSTFSTPIDFRLAPDSDDPNHLPPYPFGTNAMVTDKFTSMELCIGEDAKITSPNFYQTALPMWFDLLNLGKVVTATCSSDTHRQIREPVGSFRNYIASPKVDPRDNLGTFGQLDSQAIAHAVNQHQVVVSAGPFIHVTASKPDGTSPVDVGGTISGTKDVTLSIDVRSPDWMDWDQVEIYVNTDPTPAKDDLSGPWDKSAREFVTVNPPDHITPKYCYAPLISYQRITPGVVPDTCKKEWSGITPKKLIQSVVKDGIRSTHIDETVSLTQDSWIVVVVKGSDTAHSTFPYAPKAVNSTGEAAQDKFLGTLKAQIDARTATLPQVDGTPPTPKTPMPIDLIGGTKAYAFTNPIFIDIDGNGWTALYKDKSPLK